MRIRVVVGLISAITLAFACAKQPTFGALGDPSALGPRITAVDSGHPPRTAWVQMEQPGYAALLLVAPGHSATLLYPPDSATDNKLSAGSHLLTFQVPAPIARADSMRDPGRMRQMDSTRRGTGTVGSSRTRSQMQAYTPLPPTTQLSLLLVTSPQPLDYRRILDRTRGVTIPTDELEALNAIGKAIKSTIPTEPREWAGFYQHVELLRP